MKVLAVTADWDDLQALLKEAGRDQLKLAEEALDQMRARGFNRGRNLTADWKRALSGR